MALTLVTGLPGHGKTLYSIQAIVERSKAENRTLYVHGIPDLKIDHEVLEDPTKWHDLPDGALILIDECQKIFPKRPNGSRVPDHVAQLETHRHRGFDLHLITQHPSLIDNHVQKLIENHYHVKRHFGLQRAFIYHWPEVNDPKSTASIKKAITTNWTYPKDVFKLYRSATVHTVKRKIPFKIILGVLGVPLAVIVAFVVIQAFRHGAVGPASHIKQLEASSPTSMSAIAPGAELKTSSDSSSKTKTYNPADWSPRVQGLPHTAPAYDQITAEPSDVPLPQACVLMHNICRCYTDQGTQIDNMPREMCLNIVNNGYFNPYKTKLRSPEENQPTTLLQEKTG